MANKQKRAVARSKQGITYTQHMFGEVTFDGTEQDAYVSVTVHHDAKLIGVHYSCTAVLTAAGNTGKIELSDSGNYQGESNDNPNTICMLQLYAEGAQNWAADGWIAPINIPFISGDRVYINVTGTNTKSAKFNFTLYWEDM